MMDKNSKKTGNAVNARRMSVKILSAAIFAGCMMFGSQNVQAADFNASPTVLTADNSLNNTGLGNVSVKRAHRAGDSSTLAKKLSSTIRVFRGSGIVTGFAAEAPEVLGDEGTIKFLQEKPIDTPTLNYLNDATVLIPQKVKVGGTWQDGGDPILALRSGYSLTEVESAGENTITKYEMVEVTRYYDKTGTLVETPVEGVEYVIKQAKELVPHYYTVNTPTSEFSGDLDDYFVTSSKISWTKVEGAGENTIAVALPNGTTEYYKYTYTTPSDYTETSSQITVVTADNVDKKVFKNINSTSVGGAISNSSSDITSIEIKSDFVGNSHITDSAQANGAAIFNAYGAKMGDINGDFIGNYAQSQNSNASGGAIYNYGGSTIANITGDFIGNYAQSQNSTAYGGAIYNSGGTSIKDIAGDFIGNYVSAKNSAQGGAIYNFGGTPIANITGDFVGNYAQSQNSDAQGGAICNSSGTSISDITGDFIGNYVSAKKSAQGGAIYNNGASTIANITGDFIGNYAHSQNSTAYGGAIYNSGGTSIADITGDFIGNYAKAQKGNVWGGAIYNYNGSSIEDITGDFIGNYAQGYSSTYGGAIYNGKGIIGNITGDFIGNYAQSQNSNAWGGAIFNYTNSSIADITGDFIGNYVQGYSSTYGGAIGNYGGTIGNITGDFIGNYAKSQNSTAYGGAIYNYTNSSIEDITGDFIGNYVQGYSSTYGGAIGNYGGSIGNITGDFIGNYVNSIVASNSSVAYGGAIYNTGKIENIAGDFIGNYAQSPNLVQGGAIYNEDNSSIGNITGDFIGNYAKSQNGNAYGGAIYNYNNSSIEDITGDFIGNYVQAYSPVYGGAIYSEDNSSIGNITGDFIGNYAQSQNSNAWGGAIYNYNNSSIEDITGDFIGNYAQGYYATNGGAIYNEYNSSIGNIKGDFIGNYAKSQDSTAWGGAIYNTGKIKDIAGDFIGNYAQGDAPTNGGAIYNSSITGNIKGDFIGNYAKSQNSIAYGGAIYNTGKIKDIAGDFIGNYAQCRNSVLGGAIYNTSTIKDITGDFVGNYAKSQDWNAFGGAIYNTGTIEDIAGDFIGNYAQGGDLSSYADGGAIYNTGTIKDIAGDFIGNYALAGVYAARGGAIGNYGTIDDITGDFIENYVSSGTSDTYSGAYGGAISNIGGTTGNITGDFIGNYAISPSATVAQGGAIYNYDGGIIKDITGNFVENYATASASDAQGGAIYNSSGSSIEDITGNFIGNYVSGKGVAQGGAIYNENHANIGNITGDFIGNYATSSSSVANGGAICNDYYTGISNIIGDFVENYVSADSSAKGGAIYNVDSVGIISGSFKDNYAKSESGIAKGGAIYTITDLTIASGIANGESDIVIKGNYTESAGVIDDNAIYVDSSTATLNFNLTNSGTVSLYDNIDGQNGYQVNIVSSDGTGTFNMYNEIRNAEVLASATTLRLGVTDAENNQSDVLASSHLTVSGGVVDTVDGLYTNYNIAELNSSDSTKYSIDMVLSPEEQKADTFTLTEGGSGLVYISSINVSGPLQGNDRYVVQIIKSAVDNAPQLAYSDSSVLSQAVAVMSSDMIFADEVSLYTTNTTNDSLAITNLRDVLGEWVIFDTVEDKKFTFVNNANYILSDNYPLKGNNISIEGKGNNLNLNNNIFLDNITSNQNVNISDLKIQNSNNITNRGSLNLSNTSIDADIQNDGFLGLNKNSSVGNIRNNNELSIIELVNANLANITGTGNLKLENSKVTFDSALSGQNILAENSDITLNDVSSVFDNSLALNNSTLNTLNLGLNNLHFENFSMNNGSVNIPNVDVDLANASMGRISADNYGEISGNINVQNLNLVSYTRDIVTDVLFADSAIASNVTYAGKNHIAYSPIYKYDVSYRTDNSNGLGYFNFVRSGIGSNNSSDGFNPAVVVTPVASQTGATATMNQTFNYAFQNADNFMNIPYLDRISIKNANKYALSPTGNATDVGTYSPLFTKNENGSVWVKPYVSFENVPLKNGPKVSNVSYGTLIGFDTPLTPMKHGWDSVWTGYVGYNGASQSYSGVNSNQNGGLLGGTLTLYKGNFFNATTISAGASVANNSNMYGNEDFTMLLAGIGNKVGYNIELNEGKLIIQPNLLLSYTFVNTFDYTNAAGVKIKSDPLHSIQLAPGIKFIGNTKNGWQPYIGVNMVWNILDKSSVRANDVRLPEMSIKPYVQYGIGVQKRFKDNCMAYGQAMVQNGGRNGIAMTAGFRWAFGKESKSIEKVQQPKILKKADVSNSNKRF